MYMLYLQYKFRGKKTNDKLTTVCFLQGTFSVSSFGARFWRPEDALSEPRELNMMKQPPGHKRNKTDANYLPPINAAV